ncbi:MULTISPECIES: transposase [unclassified Moorena]|uniref:transposase n=1 Tax=unclassified Moorena TaxID=2683338 RepID=UPI0013C1933C|nr:MULTISPECIES: transposase [unclassified Moorena]NEO05663.1 IS200/IS605 family element transposase accessory protein TnpB [Moorena sp. SIO3I8]NEO10921.1 IS200/IS605 family element transposase accessory protein TnpB [Moorena sp. SIO3E8]NEO19157.1 IS200/IS605 family element transposase accessory protein TnpB [Moorena sp. SIO4A5]NEQ03155.1 IS200/IS605 family element transposase accessory protein TnpB [Moorena sp. SIO3F7]NEQ57277.1 IS200/IS605 family element transposase accessory protein TnpB [M
MKTPTKVIRTDKWKLNPSPGQKILFSETVKVYRQACRYLVGIIYTHWSELGGLTAVQLTPAVEKLMHKTAKRPNIKYPQFNKAFYKFPSYYRRAAIAFAAGQVSSYVTRYREWQSGSRKRKDSKPPRLNADTGCYPALYKGQCYKLHGFDQIEIKAFNGKDWVWTTVQITGLRERHKIATNKMMSPSLIFNVRYCHLSVPFTCKPEKRQPLANITAVDLGINTTATVAVVTHSGTVIHRDFIHLGRDIDRRDKRLKSVSARASKTMGKGGKLHKGFCSLTYQKCQRINNQIGHIVSKRIVEIAEKFNSEAIVFENLKGWKPIGGRKRSNLKQRFHGWLKAKIRDFTEMKWAELGGKVIEVVASYTSKLAFDGSGTVKRNSQKYSLATFPSGKRFNADLNGAYNIGARGVFKLTRRNDGEGRSSKSSGRPPRSWVCLCDLWAAASPRLA